MDPKFQTSFIPRNPVTGPSSHATVPISVISSSVSFLPSVGTILFILALVASGAVFAYEKVLNSQITDAGKALVLAKANFDSQSVTNLITASAQIHSAQTILDGHVAVSNMFAVLQLNVLPQVKFTLFNFENQGDGTVKISLSGEAASYSVWAEQAALFAAIPYLSNQSFSDFELTDKGTVTVKYQANLDPKLTSYAQAIESNPQIQNTVSSAVSTSTPQATTTMIGGAHQ